MLQRGGQQDTGVIRVERGQVCVWGGSDAEGEEGGGNNSKDV